MTVNDRQEPVKHVAVEADMFRSALYAFIAGFIWGGLSVPNEAEWRESLRSAALHGLVGLTAWLSLAVLCSTILAGIVQSFEEDR